MEDTESTSVPDGQAALTTNRHETDQSVVQDTAQDAVQGDVQDGSLFSTSLDPRLSDATAESSTTTTTTTTRRENFMINMPFNEYLLPQGGPINATMCDIIVLLPQWYRNPAILLRFLNNRITTSVHYAILEKHRYLDSIRTESDAYRARVSLSSSYRRIMRTRVNPSWSKQSHVVPPGWNPFDMNIGNYVPEDAVSRNYKLSPSIRFRDLANGVKLLPQDNDAGDLTNALNFAMRNMKTDEHGRQFHYMFPDDIQIILDRIGRTTPTMSNYDHAVMIRYERALEVERETRLYQPATAVQTNTTAPQTFSRAPVAQMLPPQQLPFQQQPCQQLLQWTTLDLPQQATLRLHSSIQTLPQAMPMHGMPHAYTPNPYQNAYTMIPMPMNPASVPAGTYTTLSYTESRLARSEQDMEGVCPFQLLASAAAKMAAEMAARERAQTAKHFPVISDTVDYTGYASNDQYDCEETMRYRQAGGDMPQPTADSPHPFLLPVELGDYGRDEVYAFDIASPSGDCGGNGVGSVRTLDPSVLLEGLEDHDEGKQGGNSHPQSSGNHIGQAAMDAAYLADNMEPSGEEDFDDDH